MSIDTMSAPCQQCGAELSEAVHQAAEIIYGPPSGSEFHYRLADSLRHGIATVEGDPKLAAEPDREAYIGKLAVTVALGLPSLAALTAAYRHYGRYGECRP